MAVFNGSLDMSSSGSNALLTLTIITSVLVVIGIFIFIFKFRRSVDLKQPLDDLEASRTKRPPSVASESDLADEKMTGTPFVPTPGSFLATITLNPSRPPPKVHPLFTKFTRHAKSRSTSRRHHLRISQMSKTQLQKMPGYEGGFRAALLKMTKKKLNSSPTLPIHSPPLLTT